MTAGLGRVAFAYLAVVYGAARWWVRVRGERVNRSQNPQWRVTHNDTVLR